MKRSGAFTHERLLRLFVSAPRALWRFDVDVSLEAAAKMGRFAHVAGVKGTFYVQSTCEFYNPCSPAGEDALVSLATRGHKIGLHCDFHGSFYGRHILLAVKRQRDILEAAYPGLIDPRAVSFHMPDATVLWRDFEEFDNAYASRWRGHYVSDARREWDERKEELVAAHGAIGEDVQVALHAEHWFS